MSINRPALNRTEVSTGEEAEAWISNSLRVANAYDAYGDKTEFRVRVLTRPVNISAKDYAALGGTEPDTGANSVGRFMFKGRIEPEDGMPSPHRTLPNPCTLDEATDPACAARIISWHTTFFSAEGSQTKRPDIGDLVGVTLTPGDIGKYNLQYASFNEVREISKTNNARAAQCQVTLKSIFEKEGRRVQGVGTRRMGERAIDAPSPNNAREKRESDIQKMLDEAEQVPEGTFVISQMPASVRAKIKTTAMAEYNFWEGAKAKCDANHKANKRNRKCPEYLVLDKEANPVEYARMGQYWGDTYRGTGVAEDKIEGYIKNNIAASATEVQHWSAVYISYVMRTSFNNDDRYFATNTAHHYYMTGGKKKHWKVYDAMNSAGKIKAEVGDICIGPYDGAMRSTPNTHGDIVYKIDGGKAYLTGGNVGQSVTISRKLSLDSSGFYKQTETGMKTAKYPYYVIMKFNPAESTSS